MSGRTITHYELLEKLGEGGMGVVYKARDTHLDRFTAIKFLPAEKVADTERKRRFVQGAKAASALNHPNIVTIHDIGHADGIDYIAMEYVAGKTLDQLIGRKGLKLADALHYAIQISDALAKTHSAGIVHRDLKPSNLMADEDARVGLAQVPGVLLHLRRHLPALHAATAPPATARAPAVSPHLFGHPSLAATGLASSLAGDMALRSCVRFETICRGGSPLLPGS